MWVLVFGILLVSLASASRFQPQSGLVFFPPFLLIFIPIALSAGYAFASYIKTGKDKNISPHWCILPYTTGTEK